MRSLAKSILRGTALTIVMPAVVIAWIQGRLLGANRVFPGWTQFFSLIPGMMGQYLRHAFYGYLAAECDDDVCISFGTVASHPGIRLGRSAYIGNFCSLGNVTIEKDALIASHVSVMNGCRQHGTSRLDIPIRLQPGEYESVTIGEGAWIGEHATVAASVGRHCIVGAGSLVLQPIPDYAIAVGSPARVIGDRRDAISPESASIGVQEPAVVC
jgi:virginiamycin A acetyltransferase